MKKLLAPLLLLVAGFFVVPAWSINDSLTDAAPNGQEVLLPRGRGTLVLEGSSFGGSTVTLQRKHANGNWVSISEETYTAATVKRIEGGAPGLYRVTASGGTGFTIPWEIAPGL